LAVAGGGRTRRSVPAPRARRQRLLQGGLEGERLARASRRVIAISAAPGGLVVYTIQRVLHL